VVKILTSIGVRLKFLWSRELIQALLLAYRLFFGFSARYQFVAKCFPPSSGYRKGLRFFGHLIGVVGLLVLITFTTSQAEFLLEADEEGRLHGNLRETTLEEMTSFFAKNYNIKFVGDADLLQTEVTLSFEKLSLEKALKKIFSRMNVALKYDSRGNITEVRVLPAGRKTTNTALVKTPVSKTAQALALEQDDPRVADFQPEDETASPQAEPEPPAADRAIQADQGELSADLPADDDLEVEPNSPPSGDDFEIVPSDPPSGN
jgi:hypothetical protein